VVHVWCVDTTAVADAAVLSYEEREAAARFRFERDRNRYVTSHAHLRNILSRYVGAAAGELEFGKERLGKPFLASPERKAAFNLSHSGCLALVAISSGPEVGVDIERIRDEVDLDSVARGVFAARENGWLRSLDSSERLRGFYRLWTLKEACLKAAGTGLTLAPDRFELTIGDEGIGLVSEEPALVGPWDIRELDADPGYCAAAAVRGEIGELAMFS
jgi:4'-phosphopantetheinyl transferase